MAASLDGLLNERRPKFDQNDHLNLNFFFERLWFLMFESIEDYYNLIRGGIANKYLDGNPMPRLPS